MSLREGFKRDFQSVWNGPNKVLPRLIIINVAVFVVLNLVFFLTDESIFDIVLEYIAIPTKIVDFLYRPWTFFTSFFTHYNLGHIFWNMLYLYWFGMLIRDYLGNEKLLNLYILGGMFGSLAILFLFNVMPGFIEEESNIGLGASAAVFAISVGAATLLPDYAFHLFFIGPVKIKYIVLIHVFFALIGLKGHNAGGEAAHLGGAFIGFIYIRQLQKGNDIGKWITNVIVFFKSFFVQQPKIKVSHRKASKASKKTKATANASGSKSSVSQDEIDAILDKISDKGYESLSKEEKEKLFNASRK